MLQENNINIHVRTSRKFQMECCTSRQMVSSITTPVELQDPAEGVEEVRRDHSVWQNDPIRSKVRALISVQKRRLVDWIQAGTHHGRLLLWNMSVWRRLSGD